MEGREQEREGRMSSEQEEGFHVALPWSLFPEVFTRCFGSMVWVGPDSYRKIRSAQSCSYFQLLLLFCEFHVRVKELAKHTQMACTVFWRWRYYHINFS